MIIAVGEKRLDVVVAEDITDLLDVAYIDSSYYQPHRNRGHAPQGLNRTY